MLVTGVPAWERLRSSGSPSSRTCEIFPVSTKWSRRRSTGRNDESQTIDSRATEENMPKTIHPANSRWFWTFVLATVMDSSSSSGKLGASRVTIFWNSITMALRLAGSVSTRIFSTSASTSSVWKPEALRNGTPFLMPSEV